VYHQFQSYVVFHLPKQKTLPWSFLWHWSSPPPALFYSLIGELEGGRSFYDCSSVSYCFVSRRHLLLSAEGWVYFTLAMLELLLALPHTSQVNLSRFHAFDMAIGTPLFTLSCHHKTIDRGFYQELHLSYLSSCTLYSFTSSREGSSSKTFPLMWRSLPRWLYSFPYLQLSLQMK
jgi:hypothetical protein